jgi:hypothetical protein
MDHSYAPLHQQFYLHVDAFPPSRIYSRSPNLPPPRKKYFLKTRCGTTLDGRIELERDECLKGCLS